jgi:hypothetical protein
VDVNFRKHLWGMILCCNSVRSGNYQRITANSKHIKIIDG